MGGRAATQDFFRLFLVPGMKHCSEGDGVYALDYLGYLETWLEQGKPPDMMIGAHVKGFAEVWKPRVDIPPRSGNAYVLHQTGLSVPTARQIQRAR